jgi:ribosomal protein S27E
MSDEQSALVETAAIELGGRILVVAQQSAQQLAPLVSERRLFRKTNRFPEVFTSFVFFYFHLLDRAAHAHIGRTREPLLDAIRPRLIETLVGTLTPSAPPEKQHQFTESLETMLDAYQVRLAQPSAFADEEPLKGVLWELGKLIADAVQRPGDLDVVMKCYVAASANIKSLSFEPTLAQLTHKPKGTSPSHLIVQCKQCGQRLNLPMGKGRIRAKCPACRSTQEITT